MENNKTTLQKSFLETFDNIYKMYEREYLGCSFYYGCMLVRAIREGRLNNEQLDFLYEYFDNMYGDVLAPLEKRGMSWDCRAMINLLDIAVLDEIARYCIGEDEDY